MSTDGTTSSERPAAGARAGRDRPVGTLPKGATLMTRPFPADVAMAIGCVVRPLRSAPQEPSKTAAPSPSRPL